MSTVAPGGSPGHKRKFPPAAGFLSNEDRHLNKLNTTAQITPGINITFTIIRPRILWLALRFRQ